ncbi:MAG: methyltransferase domain-containing protein [Methanobacteriota archaeon]|nr:MAG: methyltransferase domain-containing protein [Euryarchaeota archaeon]
MRRGRKRAVHTFGEVTGVEGAGPFIVRIEKSIVGGVLCIVESNMRIREGPVWIAVAPLKGGKAMGRGGGAAMTLSEVKDMDGGELTCVFRSEKGPYKWAEIRLDNRGRARNLEAGEEYLFSLMEPERFFAAYERRSIPAGWAGRSEPDEVGQRRMRLFAELSGAKEGQRILDCATGVKGYLRDFAARGCMLVCLNISLPILRRTREWLDYGTASFVRYDADLGMPFKEGSFHVVIADALLEYMRSPVSVLGEAAGLVRPGGRLLLLEPVEMGPGPDFYPQDLWEAALWRPVYDSAFSRETFEGLLTGQGFQLIERRTMRFAYPPVGRENIAQGVAAFEKIFIS